MTTQELLTTLGFEFAARDGRWTHQQIIHPNGRRVRFDFSDKNHADIAKIAFMAGVGCGAQRDRFDAC